MALTLIKWPPMPSEQSSQVERTASNDLDMLSDSGSTLSMSPVPSSQGIKTGAKRGRPRLTEDAELAKQVRFIWPISQLVNIDY